MKKTNRIYDTTREQEIDRLLREMEEKGETLPNSHPAVEGDR